MKMDTELGSTAELITLQASVLYLFGFTVQFAIQCQYQLKHITMIASTVLPWKHHPITAWRLGWDAGTGNLLEATPHPIAGLTIQAGHAFAKRPPSGNLVA